jgi:hypothetical protein
MVIEGTEREVAVTTDAKPSEEAMADGVGPSDQSTNASHINRISQGRQKVLYHALVPHASLLS